MTEYMVLYSTYGSNNEIITILKVIYNYNNKQCQTLNLKRKNFKIKDQNNKILCVQETILKEKTACKCNLSFSHCCCCLVVLFYFAAICYLPLCILRICLKMDSYQSICIITQHINLSNQIQLCEHASYSYCAHMTSAKKSLEKKIFTTFKPLG